MPQEGLGNAAQLGAHLPHVHEALGIIASTVKETDVVVYACNPNTGEVETGGSDQGYPWLHNVFEDSLRYLRGFLKNRGKQKAAT